MKKLSLFVFTLTFVLFARTAFALTVSPPTRELVGNPGDTLLSQVILYNETSKTMTLYPVAVNFGAGKGEAGQAQFYPADQDPYGTALASWITFPSVPIPLAPKQRVTLPFALNLPSNATPGGHYGALLFGTTPPAKDGAVGINSQVAILLLVKVNGKITEQGRIADFSRPSANGWYDTLPVDFALRFENDGNVHLQPTGMIYITNLLNRQVAVVPINETTRNVLPQSIRKFSNDWQKTKFDTGDTLLEKQWKSFAVGPYTARAVVNYGSSGKTETATTSFVVFPWQLLLTLFGGTVVVLWALRGLVRRYNRWIVRRENERG